MNIQKIILLIIYLLILILFLLLIYIYKNIKDNVKNTPSLPSSPSPSNPITPKPVTTRTPIPRQTTKYLLTEQAIMMAFPSSRYITSSSISIFNNLLSKNMKQEIIDKIPSDKNISLNCYVLHTNTFVPEIINNQVTQYTTSPLNEIGFGNIYDLLDNPDAVIANQYDIDSPYYNPQTLPPIVIKSVQDNPEEYDIIGAYFFLNVRNFLSNKNCTDTIYYSDVTKKISIDQNCLMDIFRNIKGNTNDNTSFLFSEGEMPMSLDDFVPRISKFLFYAFGVNELSKDIYTSFLRNC